jgi:hypothetical protein
MDKEAFTNVNEAWWLLENDPGLLVTQERDQLGVDLGWDREWYANQNRVVELFTLIENGHQRLLIELDDARDDPKRVAWLAAVRELTAPAAEAPASNDSTAAVPGAPAADGAGAGAPAAAAPGAAAAEDAGTWDDNWQMLTRLGPDSAYQFALSDDRRTVRAGTNWMSQDEATAARQAPGAAASGAAAPGAAAPGAQGAAEPNAPGAAASAPASPNAEPEAAAPAAQATATWDPSWGMFLRYEGDKYEYSLSNLLADAPGTDTPGGQPDGTWHATVEEATAARKAVADLKETFSDLVADPQAPISQEDLDAALQDPNFQQNLSAAEAALEAELAALESEG